MSANSLPKTPTHNAWIKEATELLRQAGIESARLDAELILAHTIRKPRTYLHAHGDELLDRRREDIANARLDLRLDRTPIAYIIGHKEFYGRLFKTTPAALIPRPESEAIIEMLRAIITESSTDSRASARRFLVDVGTGTGCLGITAKLEWPELDVTVTDISHHALNLARENARLLNADVQFLKTDLLRGYVTPIDIIVANLPYVDRDWEVSPETEAEPSEALYADKHGLALIYKLIEQAPPLLKNGGHLLLESDLGQQADIVAKAKQHGLKLKDSHGLITHFVR